MTTDTQGRWTPGRWQAEGWQGLTVNAHHAEHPQGIATILACPAGSHNAPLAEIKANALLIAAAPDLLAALVGLVNWGREHTSPCDDDSPHELLVRGCEAIVKAGGGL